MLGRSIERADMTARLLSTAALAAGPQVAWPTTLRACGAYEAFIRAYRGIEADRQAAEFLLLDRWFPRSIVSSLRQAEKCLDRARQRRSAVGLQRRGAAAPGPGPHRAGVPAARGAVFDLPVEMERLQRSCAAASEAVAPRYFADSGPLRVDRGVVL